MTIAVRGRAVPIVAADTDTPVTANITGKELLVTRILISNNGPAACRVRLWDTFTEEDTTVHSTTVSPVLIEDRNMLADETIEILSERGIVTAIGSIIARSTVAAADPDDVVVGVWGEFV